MSRCYCSDLESFIDEEVKPRDAEHRAAWLEFLEPYRDSIEYSIGEYDEETQSWRDYSSGIWDAIRDDAKRDGRMMPK